MRFPNQRLARLFALLQNEPLPQDELARRLAVSTRTVRTDIAALNQLMADHGASLQLNRGSGYQLQIDDERRFHAMLQTAAPAAGTPRTSADRVLQLLLRFLTSAFALKLEDLACEWFVSRNTLQGDMAEVREWLGRYELTIESRPRFGMKLFGPERAIRSGLTDLLYQHSSAGPLPPTLSAALDDQRLAAVQPLLHQALLHSGLRVSDDGERYLRLYCALAVQRLAAGCPLNEAIATEVDDDVQQAARQLAALLQPLAGRVLPAAEEAWLRVQLAARRIGELAAGTIGADDDELLVDYLLSYINERYNFALQHDRQLRADLLTHVKTLITRLRYQIAIPNPLLDNIKQHYPLAYDITLSAVTSWSKHTPYRVSENEVGFLVLHIGVGLERHYQVGYQRQPQVMLVCDSGNSTLRMLQAMLLRHYPQLVVQEMITWRDYEQLTTVEADFVVSTVRLEEKEKPVVVVDPFPSDYQLEQLGKLALLDRTRPWMLEKYFSERHFLRLEQPVARSELFRQLCDRLQQDGVVDTAFYPSVEEREAIVSTLLGEGIALPHALGLQAQRSCVYTVLAPQGIAWGDETAYVIFLLAISKEDYEQAMAIYELFVTFVRERATLRLRDCADFASFKTVAMECLSRL